VFAPISARVRGIRRLAGGYYGGFVTMRHLRLLGAPVLRTPCDPVVAFDEELRGLVADLMDTLTGEPGRAGVAAPQIGVGARVFVWQTEEGSGHLVNPTVERIGDEIQDDYEACLSLPGLGFRTPRAMRVRAHGVDQYGAPLTVAGSGFLARALQHECDHLDGRLYVDTLSGAERREALRAVRAAPWAQPTKTV